MNATAFVGWDPDGGVMRYRYNFSDTAAQIYLQTAAQRAAMDPGAMLTIEGEKCFCAKAVAGVVHVDAFAADDPYDPLALPGDEGGLAYLGRVNVTLDDGLNRAVVADHYMKWRPERNSRKRRRPVSILFAASSS